jgi:hypothetical protein
VADVPSGFSLTQPQEVERLSLYSNVIIVNVSKEDATRLHVAHRRYYRCIGSARVWSKSLKGDDCLTNAAVDRWFILKGFLKMKGGGWTEFIRPK